MSSVESQLAEYIKWKVRNESWEGCEYRTHVESFRKLVEALPEFTMPSTVCLELWNWVPTKTGKRLVRVGLDRGEYLVLGDVGEVCKTSVQEVAILAVKYFMETVR